MKWAIVFYAIFGYLDGTGTEQDISYGLTFKHHETCISFFEDNKKNIINGVRTHAETNYEHPMQLLEVVVLMQLLLMIKRIQKLQWRCLYGMVKRHEVAYSSFVRYNGRRHICF